MIDRSELSRRRLLIATGSVTAAGLAGCTGGPGEDGSTETDEEETMSDDGEDMEEGGNMSDDVEDMDEEGNMSDDGEDMNGEEMEATDPADAPRASVDRFSEAAGTLHVRGPDNDLPGPDEPVDFDELFTTTGLGPDGETAQYYDFDVQPTEPAPIYAFFRESDGSPVADQLNVVGTIPGDDGYNDFWRVHKVSVPDEYVANSITSASQLMDADYDVEPTDVLKNCPVVPEGSTASRRYGDGTADLVEGWYEGSVVSYFLFEESPLSVVNESVPTSPIYVSFNENPGEEGGGAPSGFRTEDGSEQTHNVLATLPDDEAYSPLWSVNVYDNADFEAVSDLSSAADANVLATGVATVNCPVFEGP